LRPYIAEPYSSLAGKGLELELPNLDAVRLTLLANREALVGRVERLAAAAAAAKVGRCRFTLSNPS
jgi:hypothetical protein